MQENELENAARIMVAIYFGFNALTNIYLISMINHFIDMQIETVVFIGGSCSRWYSGRHLLPM